MPVAASVNSVDNVSKIWCAASGLGAFDGNGETCLNEVNSWHTQRAQDRVIVPKQFCEAGIASECGIDLLSCSINGVAGVKHRGVVLVGLPVIDRLAD